jgi:hypothetical protein
MKVAALGPRLDGPMAPEPEVVYGDQPLPRPVLVAEIRPEAPKGESKKQIAQ